MDKKEMTQEKISALIDGELRATEMEEALDALDDADNLKKWDVYHHIGDALRSEDMSFSMSADFAKRMAARLDAEAPLTKPVAANSVETAQAPRVPPKRVYGVIGWGVAGASLLMLAMILMPRLLVNEDGGLPETVGKGVNLKQAARETNASDVAIKVAMKESKAHVSDGIFLRESAMDEYLLAHQRFSPSVYRTVLYARTANFATDMEN